MAKRNMRDGVSERTDALAAELLADSLDRLAEGSDVNVLLAVEDAAGVIASYEFADDGPEQCLEAAHLRVRELSHHKGDDKAGLGVPLRYAICYEGAIADDTGVFLDAVILEFGEQGYRSYSGYSLFEGRGMGDGFYWTDPAPAGEIEPLL